MGAKTHFDFNINRDAEQLTGGKINKKMEKKPGKRLIFNHLKEYRLQQNPISNRAKKRPASRGSRGNFCIINRCMVPLFLWPGNHIRAKISVANFLFLNVMHTFEAFIILVELENAGKHWF